MKLELTKLGRAAVEAYQAWKARREQTTYLGPTDQHNLEVIGGRAKKDASLYLPGSEKALRGAGIPVTSNPQTAPEKEMRRG